VRNHLFITLDSLRWDTFQEANLPFLRSLGPWKKATTQATYTFPAHMSFFVGKLPQTIDQTDYYDSVAARCDSDTGQMVRRRQLYRLDNPDAPRPAFLTLNGRNLIEGFKREGYLTVGTGAVSWFNPLLPAGRYLSEPFECYQFFEGPRHASHASARKQVDWALCTLDGVATPWFLFVNFGETHHRFVYEGCPWYDAPFDYGDAAACKQRQRACLEYLDGQIQRLLSGLAECDLIICSDHGEAFGEDGLWGHGFHHPVVMEVPMLIRLQP
jgi:Sulfatase